MEPLEFSIHEIISSASKDNFTSSFLVWCCYFSCLIALARISNTVLNKSRENGLPQVLPDLRRKAVSPSPLSTVSAVSLSCMLFIMSRYVCFFYTQPKVCCCFFFFSWKGPMAWEVSRFRWSPLSSHWPLLGNSEVTKNLCGVTREKFLLGMASVYGGIHRTWLICRRACKGWF